MYALSQMNKTSSCETQQVVSGCRSLQCVQMIECRNLCQNSDFLYNIEKISHRCIIWKTPIYNACVWDKTDIHKLQARRRKYIDMAKHKKINSNSTIVIAIFVECILCQRNHNRCFIKSWAGCTTTWHIILVFAVC